VLLLAGLPLLARRFLGPAGPSRAGRALRVFCWAAILALIPARIITEVFADFAPRRAAYLRVNNIFSFTGVHGASSGGAPWTGEIMILLIIAGYVAAFLFLTSRRSGVWRSTVSSGAGAGLLFGGPAAAAVLAARSGRDADGSVPPASTRIRPASTRIRQGIAAGVLANLTGALFVTAVGTSTTALMLGSALVRQWAYHGQHLSTLAFYHREQIASVSTEVYVLMCIVFPVIGLIVSSVAAVVTNPVPCQLGRASPRRLRGGRRPAGS